MGNLGLVLLNHRMDKLTFRIQRIIKKYPKLNLGLDQENIVVSFINKVFSVGFDSTIYMSNRTLNDDGKYTLCIRPKKTVLLQSQIPEGVNFMLQGTVDFTRSKSPDFAVHSLFEVQDRGEEYHELEQEVQIHLYDQREYNRVQSTVLDQEAIVKLPNISQTTKDRLKDWFEYIEWRNAIIESRLEGLYVVNQNILEQYDEYQERYFYLELTVLANTAEEINRFNNKYVRSSSLALISKEASSDPFVFSYNKEKKERELVVGEGQCTEKNAFFQEELLEKELLAVYSTPTFATFKFKIEDRNIVQQLNEVTADNMDIVISQILKMNYEKYTFLVPSILGDVVLLNRQHRAIKSLDYENNESPFITNWLFNIEQANLPDETTYEEIKTWGIDSLNTNQKNAVQGMLNAPDLFLVQGPPGTGKTTVIAEAVHQFVKQGKKVLLTSQANLAVDNVFERLTTSPDIRMIRLGKGNKISDDAKIFSEQEVLKTFYNSIDESITSRFTGPWHEEDEQLKKIRLYLQNTTYLKMDFQKIRLDLNRFKKEYEEAALAYIQLDEEAARSRKNNEEKRIQRFQIESAINWLETEDGDLTSLPFEHLKKLWTTYIQSHPDFQLFKYTNVEWAEQNHLEFLAAFKLNVQLMKQCIQFLPVVEQDIQRLEAGTAVSAEQLLEIENLEVRKREVEGYLTLSDGIKYFEEFQQIIQKIDSLKQSGSFNLAEFYNKINYFNQSLKVFIEHQLEQDKKEVVNQIFIELKEYLGKLRQQMPIKQQLSIEYLKEQLHVYRDEPIDEDGLARAEITKQRVKYEQNELKKTYEKLEKKICDLLEEATTLTQTKVTYETIEDELKQAEIKLSEQHEKSTVRRQELEPLLTEWQTRLKSKEQAKFDREHFIETYIKACNVVGISCTENPRELDKTDHVEFDVAIIDEVSKATPPEMLIPMVRARKTILVGDHRQLPPIFSEHTKQYKDHIEQSGIEDDAILNEENLERFKNMVTASLFKEYFEKADESIKTSLLVQYRMHPQIMGIINHFYEHQLKCGLDNPDVQRNHQLQISSANGTTFIHPDKHCYWVDSTINPMGKFSEEQLDGTSLINELEAQLIYETLCKLDEEVGKQNLNEKKDVGVISFYGKQVRLIKRMINMKTQRKWFKHLKVDINTVDRFQGKEKSIILVSMVRNKKMQKKYKKPSSHVASFQRINVAFSRAKELLIIFGAKSFYEDWPVELPKMDRRSDKPDIYEVYGAILTNIHQMGALFTSSDILNEVQYQSLKEGEIVGKNQRESKNDTVHRV